MIQTLMLALRIAVLVESSYEPGADRKRLWTRARRDIRQMRRQPFAGADAWSQHVAGCLAAAEGDRDGALALLRESSAQMQKLGFMTGPVTGGLLLGELLGGTEGARLVAQAEAYFAQQGFRDPRRFDRILAPGSGRARNG